MERFLKNESYKRTILLDGAMGTMIDTLVPTIEREPLPDLFNLSNRELISQIHSKYLEAGADIMGNYSQTPEVMVNHILEYLDEGVVDIVGGCCGTTMVKPK